MSLWVHEGRDEAHWTDETINAIARKHFWSLDHRCLARSSPY
jgi:hypothetical protein